ncbi:hypothetical protein BC833DRAFT_618633 [Globomyces pollinis-pini]|nr:hypothetical protein BC833DRAFT_618633 [Globomyces pollinis-pini]
MIFQSSWAVGNCAGAPTTMYVFNQSSPSPMFSFVTKEYKLPTCGNNPKPKLSGCCYSSLNNTDSVYQSTTHQEIDASLDPNQLTIAPLNANRIGYCHVTSSISNNSWGYSEAYYKSDGRCHESRIKCLLTGQLQVFPKAGCNGEPVEIELGLSKIQHQLPLLGNISVHMVTINGAQQTFDWVAYTPSSLLVPDQSVFLEKIENSCFILAGLGSILIIVYLSYKFITRKTEYMFWLLMSQLLWAIYILVDFIYYNVLFSSTSTLKYISQMKNTLFGLATLTTILNTTTFLLAFLRVKNGRYKILLYVLVFCCHILLCGGKYLDFYRLQNGVGSFVQKWQYLSPFWVLVMFIYNTLPAFYVTISIMKVGIKEYSSINLLIDLHRQHKVFSILVLTQFLNSVGYFTLAIFQNFTEYLGDDRSFLAINAPIDLSFVIHSIVNCLFIENVRTVLKVRSEISDKLQTNRSIFNTTETQVFFDIPQSVMTKEISDKPMDVYRSPEKTW